MTSKVKQSCRLLNRYSEKTSGRLWVVFEESDGEASNGRTFFTANYYLYVLNWFYVISMEFLSLSRRYPSSRNVPQRRGARKMCFLRRPHSIIAKYVSFRSSKLRESLKQAIRVNVVQVKPLVRYFSILVIKRKCFYYVFFFTLISLLRHDRQCRW